MNITTQTYQELISQSEKPVLVEFTAPWCSYCRRLAPALEQVAREHQEDLLVCQIDYDSQPELVEREQIELIPTLLLYQGGQLLGSIVAPESKAQLEDFLAESLSKPEEKTETARHVYDMLVIGGGPGGYAAALYAARAGLDTVVLEKLSAGGQMALTEQIDN